MLCWRLRELNTRIFLSLYMFVRLAQRVWPRMNRVGGSHKSSLDMMRLGGCAEGGPISGRRGFRGRRGLVILARLGIGRSSEGF